MSSLPWPWALELLQPDLMAYAQCLSRCGAQWAVALHLLEDLQQQRLEPDAACYSATMACLERGQQWRLALHLLRAAPFSLVVCGAAISACKKSHQWQWVLHLLEEMHRKKLESNLVVYNAALAACEESGATASSLCRS